MVKIISDNLVSIISLCVAMMTILGSFINAVISKRYEHKISVLKIILEAAYKEYELRTKQELERAKEANESPKVLSFSEYMIFYTKMSNVITKQKVSEEDIREALSQNKIAIDAYYKYREEYRPEYHLNR